MTKDQLPTRQAMKPDPNPQYIILFSSGSIYEQEYKPIVGFDDIITLTHFVTFISSEKKIFALISPCRYPDVCPG